MRLGADPGADHYAESTDLAIDRLALAGVYAGSDLDAEGADSVDDVLDAADDHAGEAS